MRAVRCGSNVIKLVDFSPKYSGMVHKQVDTFPRWKSNEIGIGELAALKQVVFYTEIGLLGSYSIYSMLTWPLTAR